MKCRPPEYQPNFEILDEYTVRKILVNLRNAGVESLYLRPRTQGIFGRTDLGVQFIEPCYVIDPAYKVRA